MFYWDITDSTESVPVCSCLVFALQWQSCIDVTLCRAWSICYLAFLENVYKPALDRGIAISMPLRVFFFPTFLVEMIELRLSKILHKVQQRVPLNWVRAWIAYVPVALCRNMVWHFSFVPSICCALILLICYSPVGICYYMKVMRLWGQTSEFKSWLYRCIVIYQC